MMNRNRLLQSKRKGSAIALVLLAVVILSAVGVGLLSLGLRGRILAIRNASDITARCAVDAGLTKALFEMNEKLKVQPWNGGDLPQATNELLPNCDAIYTYTLTGDIGSGFTVDAVGKSNQAERRANSILQLQGPFESAIFVQGALILKAGTLIDGYNSMNLGDTDVEVKIGTNSILPNSVILNFGVTVEGDVLIGVGGDVENVIQNQGADIEDMYAIIVEVVFPDITVPVLPDMGTDIAVHGTTLTIGPADSGIYEEIELKRAADPGILEVVGGDVVLYVTDSIDMGQDCEIVVNEGASLVMYLDGDLDSGNNAGINNKNSPLKFKLYGTGEVGQEIDLKAKGDFFGAVYAPNAEIVINAGGDIYGSFVGLSFELKSGGNFHYDEALRNVTIDDEGLRFVVEHWSE
ncbi:MAG: DUF7305 domain-containing protein [Planctomycetota bacterium]|jgi:hypothetical protein